MSSTPPRSPHGFYRKNISPKGYVYRAGNAQENVMEFRMIIMSLEAKLEKLIEIIVVTNLTLEHPRGPDDWDEPQIDWGIEMRGIYRSARKGSFERMPENLLFLEKLGPKEATRMKETLLEMFGRDPPADPQKWARSLVSRIRDAEKEIQALQRFPGVSAKFLRPIRSLKRMA